MDTTVRTFLLGYLVDANGQLPVTHVQTIVSERIDHTYLQEYDPSTEAWTATWQSIVFKVAVAYFVETGQVVTPPILQARLVGEGVTGDTLSGYVRALENARLQQNSDAPVGAANLHFYITELRKYRLHYEWQRTAILVDEMMKSDPKAGLALLGTRLGEFKEMESPASEVWDFKVMAKERWERHERFAKMEGRVHGIETGLLRYDETTRGMLPGEFTVVVGRTSQGKTVTLQHAAVRNVFNTGGKVVYVSSEMGWSRDHNSLMDRFEAMAMPGLTKAGQLRWGSFDPASREALKAWYAWFADTMQGNLFVIPPSRCSTITEVCTEVRRIAQREGKLDLICVDYINEISGMRREAYLDKRVVCRGLMRLGEEMECPVLAAAQVSRYGQMRGEDADVGELMSESEYIAKVADVVIRVFKDKMNESRIIFQVLKDRHGRAGWSFSANMDWSVPRIGGGWQEEDMDERSRLLKRAASDRKRLDG